MRMSCSGCRVLRKGCSDDCSIRPCLQWIKNSEHQANATLFLAKFYGRAGLLNLINAGPQHHRPAIFKSMLYEACGRIVNPIHGSAGLLLSGSWNLCQAAVEAVLKGEPITQVSPDSEGTMSPSPPLKACDIRHVAKEDSSASVSASASAHSDRLHKVNKSKSQFKRSGLKSKQNNGTAFESDRVKKRETSPVKANIESSNDSRTESVETEEATLVKPEAQTEFDSCGLNLELSLAIAH